MFKNGKLKNVNMWQSELYTQIIKNANSNIISELYTKAKMGIGITYEKFT